MYYLSFVIMSEEIKPEVLETPDVAQDAAASVKETIVNYSEKTLAELSALFQELSEEGKGRSRS